MNTSPVLAAIRSGTTSSMPIATEHRRRTPSPRAADVAMTTNLYWSSFRRDWWRQSSNSAQRPNDSGDPRCGGMANLNTTCGNEGRLRQYYSWGVEPRVSVASSRLSASPARPTSACGRISSNQDRLQENGDTPTRSIGRARREQPAQECRLLRASCRTGSCSARGRSHPVCGSNMFRYERTNRLANGGAGVTR